MSEFIKNKNKSNNFEKKYSQNIEIKKNNSIFFDTKKELFGIKLDNLKNPNTNEFISNEQKQLLLQNGVSPDYVIGCWRIFNDFSIEDILKIYKVGIDNNFIFESKSILGNNLANGKNYCELFSKPGAKELYLYLKNNPYLLKIGIKNISLGITVSSVQMFNGILHMLGENGVFLPNDINGWNNLIKKYEIRLNDFISKDNGPDGDFKKIFFLGAKGKDEDIDGVFNISFKYKQILEKRYGEGILDDYSTGTNKGDTIKSPEDFIFEIEKYLQKNPEKRTLAYIGLHGTNGYGSVFSKGTFTPKHYEKLKELSLKYPNFIIEGDGCYVGTNFGKRENFFGNICLNSDFESGVGNDLSKTIEAFKENKYIDKNIFESLKNTFGEEIFYILNHTRINSDIILYGVGENNKAQICFNNDDIDNIIKKVNNNIDKFARIINIKKIPTKNSIKKLLEDILKYSKNDYIPSDFTGNGKVSYNESQLYKILNYDMNFLPTYYVVIKNNKKVSLVIA